VKFILDLLKRIFSRPEDRMSDGWIKDHLNHQRIEFQGVCWSFPVVKDF